MAMEAGGFDIAYAWQWNCFWPPRILGGFYFALTVGELFRVSFQFKTASAVAAGTFNIYIVQPRWLREVKILEGSERIKMQADYNRPGFRFKREESRIRWEVRPDRIVLDTDSPDVDCGHPLERVIEVLKWTPLMGIGTNVDFEADISILETLRYRPHECTTPDGFRVRQKTWHVGLEQGAQLFNFQVSVEGGPTGDDPEKVSLSINVHTEITKDKSHEVGNEIGREACRNFLAHRRKAVQLVSDLLNTEIAI